MSVSQRFILALVVASLGLGLAGCGTMRGIGEDVQGAGRAIKRAAG
jgi:predicted small secreted protein